jgi:hypothetical protein
MVVHVGFVVDKATPGLVFLPVYTIIQKINIRRENVAESIVLLRIENCQAQIANVLKQGLCHVSINVSIGARCA